MSFLLDRICLVSKLTPAKLSLVLRYDRWYLMSPALPRRLVNGTLSLIPGVGLVTSSFWKAARAFDKLHSS